MPRHSSSIPKDTKTFAFMSSIIASMSIFPIMIAIIASGIVIPSISSIAATIWFTSKVIWAFTAKVNSTSRAANTASMSRPVALIAAHIWNMVAFSFNPKLTASAC